MTYEIETTSRGRMRLWRDLYRRGLPEWFLTDEGWVFGVVVALRISHRGWFRRFTGAWAEIKPHRSETATGEGETA